MAKRFVVMSDEELQIKSKQAKNDNTLKTERRAN